ncbi:MAG: response regulator transcription factor [Acidimicrobiia bacterium]|nr:response regulator transcription factor [Acidimicrobiia bacterium]
MTVPTPIRVLLVDDQALVRRGFRLIVESEADLCVVGEAANGREGVDEARRLRPDVVLMDVRMPEMDGVEATGALAGSGVADPCRVLILTTFNIDDYVYAALRNGASGFLLKDAPPEDLVAAIRIVARGDALLDPAVTRTLIADVQRRAEPGRTVANPALDELTEREREVLVEVARGRSNAEIAEALFVSETTVKTHVGHILAKLGLRDRVQVVVAAYESGLVRPGD